MVGLERPDARRGVVEDPRAGGDEVRAEQRRRFELAVEAAEAEAKGRGGAAGAAGVVRPKDGRHVGDFGEEDGVSEAREAAKRDEPRAVERRGGREREGGGRVVAGDSCEQPQQLSLGLVTHRRAPPEAIRAYGGDGSGGAQRIAPRIARGIARGGAPSGSPGKRDESSDRSESAGGGSRGSGSGRSLATVCWTSARRRGSEWRTRAS